MFLIMCSKYEKVLTFFITIDIFLCMLDSDLFFANHSFYVTKKQILTWCNKLLFYKRAKCALVYNCRTTCMQISQRRNTLLCMLCNGFKNNSRSYNILFKFFVCAFWTSSKLLLLFVTYMYNTNFLSCLFHEPNARTGDNLFYIMHAKVCHSRVFDCSR